MASVNFMGFVLACTAPGLVTSLACSGRSEVEGAVRKILVSSAVALVGLSTAVVWSRLKIGCVKQQLLLCTLHEGFRKRSQESLHRKGLNSSVGASAMSCRG